MGLKMRDWNQELELTKIDNLELVPTVPFTETLEIGSLLQIKEKELL